MDVVTIGNHELYKVESSDNEYLHLFPHYGVDSPFPPPLLSLSLSKGITKSPGVWTGKVCSVQCRYLHPRHQ